MSRFDIDTSGLTSGAELASGLAAVGERAKRWRPGLAPCLHNELFSPSGEGSGSGAALALAMDAMCVLRANGEDRRSVFWMQDETAVKLNGRPYRPGLPADIRHRLIYAVARKPEDALFALEEALQCRDFACVIGEMAGNPRALDFTASRRLSLATEKHGVPLFLVRLDARPDLSSARMRWQVRSAPSEPPKWNGAAPGSPRWEAELFRSRAHAPGKWILHDDGQALAAEQPNAAGGAAGGTFAPDHVSLDSRFLGRTVVPV